MERGHFLSRFLSIVSPGVIKREGQLGFFQPFRGQTFYSEQLKTEQSRQKPFFSLVEEIKKIRGEGSNSGVRAMDSSVPESLHPFATRHLTT